jgi:predicted NUDIX family phosphoesterase
MDADLEKLLVQKRIHTYDELTNSINHIQFDLRSDIEDNNNYIQPIPIIVITNKNHDKILIVKKNSKAVSKDSPEKDKLLLDLFNNYSKPPIVVNKAANQSHSQ